MESEITQLKQQIKSKIEEEGFSNLINNLATQAIVVLRRNENRDLWITIILSFHFKVFRLQILACKVTNRNKIQVIEIVENNKNKKIESVTNLLD